jgi:hypothetical protein
MHGVLHRNARTPHLRHERIGIFGINQKDLIAGPLDRFCGGLHRREEGFYGVVVRAELEDLGTDVLLDEFLGGSPGDDTHRRAASSM